MTKPRQGISIEELRALFTYNPETGLLFWKNGAQAGLGKNDGYHCVYISRKAYYSHRVVWAALHYGEFALTNEKLGLL